MEPSYVSLTPPIRHNKCLDVSREIAQSETHLMLPKAEVCEAIVKEWSWFELHISIA